MSQALRLLAHPTRMLRVLLLLVLLVPSVASAQSDVLLLSAHESGIPATDVRAWVSALRRAIGTTHTRRLQDSDCAPEADAACAARFTHASQTSRIVLVRVVWDRAACVPMREADGTHGSRLLRTATMNVSLLDANGVTIAHQSRPVRLGDDEDRNAAAQALAHALGL